MQGNDLKKNKILRDLDYINSTTIGLENDFEIDKRFNISDFDFDIPSINRWRFKTDEIQMDSKKLFTKKYFLVMIPSINHNL